MTEKFQLTTVANLSLMIVKDFIIFFLFELLWCQQLTILKVPRIILF